MSAYSNQVKDYNHMDLLAFADRLRVLEVGRRQPHPFGREHDDGIGLFVGELFQGGSLRLPRRRGAPFASDDAPVCCRCSAAHTGAAKTLQQVAAARRA